MAFLLGSLTSGLFGGAHDVMGMFDTAAQVAQRREQTRALKQETDMKQAAYDAAKNATSDAQNQQLQQDATQPTESTPAPDAAGAPRGPIKLEDLPAPKHLSAVNTSVPVTPVSPREHDNTPVPAATPTPPAQPTQPTQALPIAGGSPDQAVGTSAVSAAAPGQLPQGRLIWTPTGGLHRAQPGESGITYSLDQGLHRTQPSEWAGTPQQPAALPTQVAQPAATTAPREFVSDRHRRERHPPTSPQPAIGAAPPVATPTSPTLGAAITGALSNGYM